MLIPSARDIQELLAMDDACGEEKGNGDVCIGADP
jgi:hypothetical protein